MSGVSSLAALGCNVCSMKGGVKKNLLLTRLPASSFLLDSQPPSVLKLPRCSRLRDLRFDRGSGARPFFLDRIALSPQLAFSLPRLSPIFSAFPGRPDGQPWFYLRLVAYGFLWLCAGA
jgi:hypothetical protein